jgi:hypothetical protein
MASAAEDLREDEMNKDSTPIQPTKSATQEWGRWGERLATMIADQKTISAARKTKDAYETNLDE